MSTPTSPHPLAVVAADAERRTAVQSALRDLGYQVVICAAPEHLDVELLRSTAPEAWVVELEMTAEECPFLELLMDTVQVPTVFGDGLVPNPDSAGFDSWRRRLGDKLVASLESPLPAQPPADSRGMALGAQGFSVWLLAASLGGPQAVKLFLDSLPAGLPVAFLYAQHIDRAAQQTLLRVLARHSAYRLVMAADGVCLSAGSIYMVPVDTRVNLGPDGLFRDLQQPWSGPYNPCIDEVMVNVAKSYGESAGTIVFSGMGGEGPDGGRELLKLGGRLWAQDRDSCGCSAMPDTVAEALGPEVMRRPPEVLAALLAGLYEQRGSKLMDGSS